MNDACSFNVYPNINITKKIVKCSYVVAEYLPFTSAKLACMLFDENDRPIESRFFTLEGEDFLQWGSDDKYLTNWLKGKINTL